MNSLLGTPPIKDFSIAGLLGDRDVRLSFENPATILIADNGTGKTTILGALYAVLSRQFQRLQKLDFERITVTFSDGNLVEVPKELVASPIDPASRRFLASRVRNLPPSHAVRIAELAAVLPFEHFQRVPEVREARRLIGGVPTSFLYEMGKEYKRQPDLWTSNLKPKRFESTLAAISKHFPHQVLYFPTYRRIEEDIENLGFARSDPDDGTSLIQFGMNDVNARIQNVTDKIRKLSLEWFNKTNGQMISQLVDGINIEQAALDRLADIGTLRLVLDRTSANLTSSHKSHILELVASGEISRHETLAYFLSNLVQVYDHQRSLDDSIKAFISVCNGYLVDKEFIYNEGTVELAVHQRWNQKDIKLARLSSGEKQIISLFSKLYLEDSSNLTLLFDEPELSLSVEWQKRLLPDVLRTGKCIFLVATTHSPFVFENELDIFAKDLTSSVTRRVENA